MRILSLCDYSGVMVQPWADAGHECVCADIHQDRPRKDGGVWFMEIDAFAPWFDSQDWDVVFAFPPCTHLSGSGARWWAEKGLQPYIESLQLVARCLDICRTAKLWMLENPVGRLSQTLGDPSFTFHPYEYAGYLEDDRDHYKKRTCIWASDNFVQPRKRTIDGIDHDPRDDIWRMAPSDDRARKRSLTPAGFARAVFEANHALAIDLVETQEESDDE